MEIDRILSSIIQKKRLLACVSATGCLVFNARRAIFGPPHKRG
jgi:hypothetical protein